MPIALFGKQTIDEVGCVTTMTDSEDRAKKLDNCRMATEVVTMR